MWQWLSANVARNYEQSYYNENLMVQILPFSLIFYLQVASSMVTDGWTCTQYKYCNPCACVPRVKVAGY